MLLTTANYADQVKCWPQLGQHILASFDEETIVVYQAYRPSIGKFAIEHGYFGGDFSYTRMSWIKPNFLWMMYRSQWGQSEGQEVVMAIRLRRPFFDSLLLKAVPSSFDAKAFRSHEEWTSCVARSEVRLQWDPDHLPTGEKCERRAIQLGLRGQMLEAYGKREIIEIIDMSAFVSEQRANVQHWQAGKLMTPCERVYCPANSDWKH
jgi:hypothetical protein